MLKQTNSKSRLKRNLSHTPSKSRLQTINNSESQYYFCHYKNAIYMGGIKAFQKHGRGIMLHDNGTSAVTSYFNDFKNGHNILYKQNCVMSIQYQKNKIIECALRISTYLLLIRFDKNQKPDGKTLLIDYNNRSIIYVIYKKGVIKQKHEQNEPSVLNRIFDLQNIEYLIGDNHSKAIKFEIQMDQNIGSQKSTSKFQSGFYKKGLLNGLGFTLIIRDPLHNIDTIRISTNFYLKISQRGYYTNGKLNGIGQKWFKNGNFYFGDFKDGAFQGKGILKNQMKKNWVFGAFQMGNMSQLIDYCSNDNEKKLQKIIQSIHQRKNNWINNSIQLQSHQKMTEEIQNILKSSPTQQLKNLKHRKLQVLRKIQDNFISDPSQDNNYNQQNEQQQQIDELEDTKPRNNFYLDYFPQTNSSKASLHKNYDGKTNDSSVKTHFYSKNDQRYEQDITTNRRRQEQQSSIFKINIIQPNNSRLSSSRQNYYKLIPKKNLESSRQQSSSRHDFNMKRTQQDRVQYVPINEKRFIERSKIFSQQQNSQQQLPKFNYSPFKSKQ